MELRTFSMNPSAEDLSRHLKINYPGASYKSVYEAGFCGYGIDKKLKEYGIENIIVNAADVPTKSKERSYKNDKIDSRKLARELESQTISGIYVPSEKFQELRSLSRLRQQLVKDQTRIKNRIKGLLMFYGKHLPENSETKYWGNNFIKYLESLEFSTSTGQDCLSVYLRDFKEKRTRILDTIRKLRQAVRNNEHEQTIKNLCTVPGVGFLTAITLYTELIDINRFSSIDHLCSYVGLTPSVNASADNERVRGLTRRHNKYLRNIMIEAAWVAVRIDPALTEKFGKLTRRMCKQKAIIRMTKSLLSRISFFWKNNTAYELRTK
jgi:transposase